MSSITVDKKRRMSGCLQMRMAGIDRDSRGPLQTTTFAREVVAVITENVNTKIQPTSVPESTEKSWQPAFLNFLAIIVL